MFGEGLNTKHFEVRISNGLVLEWWILAIAMVLTIPKLKWIDLGIALNQHNHLVKEKR